MGTQGQRIQVICSPSHSAPQVQICNHLQPLFADLQLTHQKSWDLNFFSCTGQNKFLVFTSIFQCVCMKNLSAVSWIQFAFNYIQHYSCWTLDFHLQMAAPETVTFSVTVSCKNNEGTVISSLVMNTVRKKHTQFEVLALLQSKLAFQNMKFQKLHWNVESKKVIFPSIQCFNNWRWNNIQFNLVINLTFYTLLGFTWWIRYMYNMKINMSK